MEEINVTPENSNEITSRIIEREKNIFDLNMSEAKRITNEVSDKIFSGEKLSTSELKRLASLAAQYELILSKILDEPCHFYYIEHKDYSERLKTFCKKCIKELKKAQKIIERKIRLKEGEIETQAQTQKIEIPKLKDNSELKQKAQDYLVALSGKWINGVKIMTDEEYTKVVQGVFNLIDTGQVLPIDKKIKTPATMIFIRKLFWTIHKELYTTKKIKDSFIKFLHTYFERFSDPMEETTKQHFSEYLGIFDSDYKKVLDSIKK